MSSLPVGAIRESPLQGDGGDGGTGGPGDGEGGEGFSSHRQRQDHCLPSLIGEAGREGESH